MPKPNPTGDKEKIMQKRLIAASLLVLVASPALAAEYYLAQDPTTKQCRVVDVKPDGKTMVMVGTSSYATKAEAFMAATKADDCKATAAETQKQQAFKTLVQQGYEIKAVSIREHVRENERSQEVEHVVVSLQKGASIAVCTFLGREWENLIDTALEETGRCDVR